MNVDNLKFGQSIDYLKELEKQRDSLKGKKRKRFNELTKQNKRKLLRNSGQGYVTITNKFIGGKTFRFTAKCCPKNCHFKVKEEDQKKLFEHFWCLANYNKQNLYLFGLISRKSTNKTFSKWQYHVDINGSKIMVCKILFMGIYQVTKHRLTTLQKKITDGKSFDDERGHQEKCSKTSTKTWELLDEFIDKIPKKVVGKYHKLYFVDTSITKRSLHKDFCKLLNEKDIKTMSSSTFTKYYDEKFHFGFSYTKKNKKKSKKNQKQSKKK